MKPDIGSIVAYALASLDYEDSRKRALKTMKGEETPLNLSASTTASLDDSAIEAEHYEYEFSDHATSYYVKVGTLLCHSFFQIIYLSSRIGLIF